MLIQNLYPLSISSSYLFGTKDPNQMGNQFILNCFISSYILVSHSFVLNLSIFFLLVLPINQLITIPLIRF